MDKALIKLFEKEMFNKENSEDGFRNFVLDYYKKHSLNFKNKLATGLK